MGVSKDGRAITLGHTLVCSLGLLRSLGRNKEWGAFVTRKKYDSITLKPGTTLGGIADIVSEKLKANREMGRA